MDRAKYLVLITLGMLLLSLALPSIPLARAQAPTVTTDKPLYAIKWKNNALGYVNVTVMLTGLDPETRYEIAVFKFHGPAGLNYVKEVYGVYGAEIKFTIPPTMDARPEDIAGTWNATLYRIVGETRIPVRYVNFGVWAINARVLNYGRVLQVWGGGFEPGAKVNFTVYEKTASANVITDDLFGEDPAKCLVSGKVCVEYGTFSNASKAITIAIPKRTYTVNLTQIKLIPTKSSPGAPETTLDFDITDELLVNILKPADGSEWRRTDTVPVEVEVLYQDMVPVTAGIVNVTFTPPKCTPTAQPPYDNPKTISLKYSPVTKTWVGSFKIQYNNSTGADWPSPKNWNVTASAGDMYGNSGSDTNKIKVYAAILVVATEVPPPASVPRAMWVSWVIKVTYKGDGMPAKLELPLCTVYVVNATTKAIVGSAYLEEIAVGRYNVTWFVPADAPLGDYMFLIPANSLYDNVTTCGVRNVGPEANVYSPAFSVGITKLKVIVKTYGEKFKVATEKVAFAPGSMVHIGASVTYADSGVVMTAGYVRAYIYNATGGLVGEIPMTYDSGTRMWWCSWDSTKKPAGRYTVVVKARDPGYNLGEGETFFFISGLAITPNKGTVPPIGCTVCQNITKAKDEWLVTATVFTDPVSGKSLGTKVVIEGFYMTPNSKVNVTVDWLPYPALTGAKKILLAMNVPTNAEGYFKKEIVFPTTIKGIYNITAIDLKGVKMMALFEVIPGMILTPDPVVGSALIKVIATGLPRDASALDLLMDGTDALSTIAGHAGEYLWSRWYADENGTLVSESYGFYVVKPGFIMPAIEPGTYAFALYMEGGEQYNATGVDKFPDVVLLSVSDSVKVINAFKELGGLVSDVAVIKASIAGLNTAITEVKDGVATIKTDIGALKVKVDDLIKALSDLNAIITEVRGGVATIRTDVGVIKSNVDTLSMALNGLKALVVEVGGDVAVIKTDVGSIKVAVGALDAIKSRVDAISTKVDSVSGKVDTVSGKVDAASKAAEIASGIASTLIIPVWIAVILSLVAAIASIIAIVQVTRKIAG